MFKSLERRDPMTSKAHGLFLAAALMFGLHAAAASYQLSLVGHFLRNANGLAARIVQQASPHRK
jgi:hypothetical protein